MLRRRTIQASGAIGAAKVTFHEVTTMAFVGAVGIATMTIFGLGAMDAAHRIGRAAVILAGFF